ncbi:MAG: prepilin-type N-terminal cleavage/methylation domain-containing protein [Desulfobacterales bacterium]|nr:prepilin-type N-terminal cleavage/methylation domain-containing protein [Desulfobacterales bacterium]
MINPISEKGFSMIELLIVMAVSTIVLGALVGVFIIHKESLEQQEQILDMQENARAGIEIMTRELAMAGYDPRGGAGAGIVAANSESIVFSADLNEDCGNLSSDSGEYITYAYDATDKQLTRKATASDTASPLAENIQSLSFTYYNSSNVQTAVLADIRRITVQLVARTRRPDPGYASNSGYRTRTYTVDVTPRNLNFTKSNLCTSSTTTTAPVTTTTAATTTTTTTAVATTTTTAAATTTTGVTTTTTTATTTTAPVTTTTAAPADSSGPTISNVTQSPAGSTVEKNVDVQICANVTDVSGVSTVTLTTNQDGNLAMSLSSGNTYCATIPKHNNQTVTYYITAIDTLGNESSSSTYQYTQSG